MSVHRLVGVPDIVIVDGLDPTVEYRSALRQQLDADPSSPVRSGTHNVWVAYPHPAQNPFNPTPPNFAFADDTTRPLGLRGIGDMRAIPVSTDANAMAGGVATLLHEMAHRWLVPYDLQVRMNGQPAQILSGQQLTVDIFADRPYTGPALMGRPNGGHWGAFFQSDGSPMDGIAWTVTPDAHGYSKWTQYDVSLPVQPAGLPAIDIWTQYCDLDLLIMGVKAAEECYLSSGGSFAWSYPKLSVGTPIDYHSGLFVAFGPSDFAYFGFYSDHRSLRAEHAATGWRSPIVDISDAYDALGGETMMLRAVVGGGNLLFQACRGNSVAAVLADRGPFMFDDVDTAADAATSGSFQTWQTVASMPLPTDPVGIGLLTKTWNPILAQGQFWSFETYQGGRAGALPVFEPSRDWDGSSFAELDPTVLYRHVPQPDTYLPPLQRRSETLLISTAWDQSFDHWTGVDHAPKVLTRAPAGDFAFGTTAAMYRTAISPSSWGGGRGTTMWGEMTTAAVADVIVPASLDVARHDPLPWQVAFIIAAADASAVTDDDLEHLDALRRYFEAAVPVASRGALSISTELPALPVAPLPPRPIPSHVLPRG